MVRRGGGMIASNLLELEKLYLEREGGSITINW